MKQRGRGKKKNMVLSRYYSKKKKKSGLLLSAPTSHVDVGVDPHDTFAERRTKERERRESRPTSETLCHKKGEIII